MKHKKIFYVDISTVFFNLFDVNNIKCDGNKG